MGARLGIKISFNQSNYIQRAGKFFVQQLSLINVSLNMFIDTAITQVFGRNIVIVKLVTLRVQQSPATGNPSSGLLHHIFGDSVAPLRGCGRQQLYYISPLC